MKVLNEGSLTVALDPEIGPELLQEGIVRDIVRSVQSLRKERGLEVTDRITLYISGPEAIREAVESFQGHLQSETLADGWEWGQGSHPMLTECGDQQCSIDLLKSE